MSDQFQFHSYSSSQIVNLDSCCQLPWLSLLFWLLDPSSDYSLSESLLKLSFMYLSIILCYSSQFQNLLLGSRGLNALNYFFTARSFDFYEMLGLNLYLFRYSQCPSYHFFLVYLLRTTCFYTVPRLPQSLSREFRNSCLFNETQSSDISLSNGYKIKYISCDRLWSRIESSLTIPSHSTLSNISSKALDFFFEKSSSDLELMTNELLIDNVDSQSCLHCVGRSPQSFILLSWSLPQSSKISLYLSLSFFSTLLQKEFSFSLSLSQTASLLRFMYLSSLLSKLGKWEAIFWLPFEIYGWWEYYQWQGILLNELWDLFLRSFRLFQFSSGLKLSLSTSWSSLVFLAFSFFSFIIFAFLYRIS